jgi:hypothetical protein
MHGYDIFYRFDYPPLVSLLFMLFLLAAGGMALLVPFFIFRIRNEVIELNRRMAEVVAQLEKLNARVQAGGEPGIEIGPSGELLLAKKRPGPKS